MSGTTGLILVNTTPATTCASGQYALLTESELDAYMVSPWKLDLNEAGPIIGAVLLLWGLAFGFRMAIRAVRDVPVTLNEGSD